jgi:hypothetical protein
MSKTATPTAPRRAISERHRPPRFATLAKRPAPQACRASKIVVQARPPGPPQNRKYLCAIGSSVAGSQVSSWPSARTS